MPYDKESGEKYDSPKDALQEVLPEGASAEEVLKKLSDMGYSLESSEPATVGVAIGIETEEEEEEKTDEPKEEKEEKEETEEAAPAGEDKELEPGGAPSIGEAEKVGISMGMVGADEPMAKRRDAVAENLMDKFKKGMV